MAESELDYLKSLVAQLNSKIAALEAKAKGPAEPKTPAQQLRTILIGPPGAGACSRAQLGIPSLSLTKCV